MIGFTNDVKNPIRRKKREVKKEKKSALKYTPFRGIFRWRRY